MKTPEEVAGEMCERMHARFAGSDWTKALPTHICVVLGKNEWHRPLWRRRVMKPDNKIFLDESFDEYLTLPYARGLGFESWFTIHMALETQGRHGAEAIAMIRAEVPDYDERVRRDRQQNLNEVNEALAKHGEIGGGHAGSRGSHATSDVGRGAGYLISRLKRDAPAVAERFAKGEFRSARAAAIEAGIIVPSSALDNLLKYWRRCTDAEKRAFFKAVKRERETI